MSHNSGANIVLGAILFGVNTLVFKGGGTWSAILIASAQVTGTLLSADSGDFYASADRAYGLLPIVVAIVVNIILYYILAGIIIFLFSFFTKKSVDTK